jgi:hypothetical protein
MKSVVSGKFTNVYSENDYILAFLYRATSIQLGVAGLQKIEDVEGIENVDLSKEVSGHLRYPELLGKILKRCGVEGVLVDDSEIEKDVNEELIDVDIDGFKSDVDAKHLSNTTDLELLDFEPSAAGPSSERYNAPNISEQSREHQDHRLPPRSPSISMPEGSTRTQNLPAYPIHASSSNREIRRDDSDSEDGGIQMIDNDFEDELQVLTGDPIEEDRHLGSVQQNTGRDTFTSQEPKSLGSFPRQGGGSGGGSGSGSRIRASDMGLY